MAKAQFTFQSNVKKVIEQIDEVPEKVLSFIGQNLVKEIRPLVKKRTGRLKKSLGYWARKKEKDLQIGFKIFYAPFVYNRETDPIKPVVLKYKDEIKDIIAYAIDTIGKR